MAGNRTSNASTNIAPIEDDECVFFAAWLRSQGIPFAHIANESRSSSRNAMIRGAKLKRMGQSRGVWDYEIYLPVKDCDGDIGAYELIKLEMKRRKRSLSTVSPEQKQWGKIYEMAGIRTAICYGADEAIAFVRKALAELYT